MLIAQYLLALRIGRARGVVDEALAERVVHGLHLLPARSRMLSTTRTR